MTSLEEYKKRAARRVIRGELPEDLELEERDWLLRLIRQYVPRERDGIERHREQGGKRRQAFQYPRMFHVPGSSGTSRLVSHEGHVPFHFARNEVKGREAAAFDHYSSSKTALAMALDEQESKHAAEAREVYMSDHGGSEGLPPAGFTNLAQGVEKRGLQWRAIEEHERSQRVNPDGQPPGITFRYDRCPELFDAVTVDPDCPGSMRAVIAAEKRRAASGKPISPSRAERGTRWTDEVAFTTFAWLTGHPLWPQDQNGKNAVAKVSGGRPVQTHLAGEGEYHRALDAAARERIRMGLVAFVQDQANDPAQRDNGSFVPMTIFDHAPDGLNDARNDHFHFLIGTRRVHLDAEGGLAFDDKKVDAITRRDWIMRMRMELARLTNVELAAIDHDERFHPGTLQEMGITQIDADITAMQKMHGRRTVLERAAFPTDTGLDNDLEAWRRKFAAADRAHAAATAQIEKDHAAEDRIAVRAQALEAAQLRHEAAHIAILVDMARSRPEQTAHYAPEYALAAKSASAKRGWQSRGSEAEAWLVQLDVELTPERDGIAQRLAEAMRIDAGVAAAVAEPAIVAADVRQDTPPPARTIHRIVDIIANAPLQVTEQDGSLVIAREDDPAGLVVHAKLMDASTQKRLAGIRAAQKRELAQVQAFATKFRYEALHDPQAMPDSDWLRGAIVKWRDAPVMARWAAAQATSDMVPHPPVPVLRPSIPETQAASAKMRRGPVRFLDEMASLADLPFLDELPSMRDMPFLDDTPALTAAKTADAIDKGEDRSITEAAPARPPQVVTASTMPSQRLSADDVRFAQLQAMRRERDIDRVADAVQAALEARAGDAHSLTAHGARLLGRISEGFDPDGVERRIAITGRSLDQRDRDEIVALRHSPVFRIREAAARNGNPELRRLVRSTLAANPDIDLLARVGVQNGRLAFGVLSRSDAGPHLSPRDWLERRDLSGDTLAKIPLTNHDGRVGLHDRKLLGHVQHNHVALLYPDVQFRLEIAWRLQREEDEALLRDIGAGTAKVDATFRHGRIGEDTIARVDAQGALASHPSILRRRHDPDWYIACRKAQQRIEPLPPPRHPDTYVAAWLRARDEDAIPALLAEMTRHIRTKKGRPSVVGLTPVDARAIAGIFMTPPPALQRRRKQKRSGPPLQPGKGVGD